MTLRLYPQFPKAGFGDVRRLAGLRIHLYIPHPSTLLIYFFHISWIYLKTKTTTVSQIIIGTSLENLGIQRKSCPCYRFPSSYYRINQTTKPSHNPFHTMLDIFFSSAKLTSSPCVIFSGSSVSVSEMIVDEEEICDEGAKMDSIELNRESMRGRALGILPSVDAVLVFRSRCFEHIQIFSKSY